MHPVIVTLLLFLGVTIIAAISEDVCWSNWIDVIQQVHTNLYLNFSPACQDGKKTSACHNSGVCKKIRYPRPGWLFVSSIKCTEKSQMCHSMRDQRTWMGMEICRFILSSCFCGNLNWFLISSCVFFKLFRFSYKLNKNLDLWWSAQRNWRKASIMRKGYEGMVGINGVSQWTCTRVCGFGEAV